MIRQISDQSGVNVSDSTKSIQVRDDSAQLFGIGAVLVLGTIVGQIECVRVAGGVRERDESRAAIDSNEGYVLARLALGAAHHVFQAVLVAASGQDDRVIVETSAPGRRRASRRFAGLALGS